MAEVFRELRRASSSCMAESYIEVASRSLLSGRLAEALWTTTAGLNLNSLKPQEEQKLLLLQGHIYHEMGRYEEAIIVLRKAAFGKTPSDDLAQQAHLLLIKVYFARAGNTMDANVRYLANLFRNRYPQSPYLAGLIFWLQQPS